MNEKLTAYALNELPPDERAALEALMKDDPKLREESDEMKAFCEMLDKEIHAGADDTLKPEQRTKLVQTFQSTERNIIRPLWRRPAVISGLGLAAAACVALMFTWYEVKDGNHTPREDFLVRRNGTSSIALGDEGSAAPKTPQPSESVVVHGAGSKMEKALAENKRLATRKSVEAPASPPVSLPSLQPESGDVHSYNFVEKSKDGTIRLQEGQKQLSIANDSRADKTLSLDGVTTYSGGTTLNGGTVAINNAAPTPMNRGRAAGSSGTTMSGDVVSSPVPDAAVASTSPVPSVAATIAAAPSPQPVPVDSLGLLPASGTAPAPVPAPGSHAPAEMGGFTKSGTGTLAANSSQLTGSINQMPAKNDASAATAASAEPKPSNKYEPALTPGHFKNAEEVKRHLQTAQSYNNVGDYEKANAEYQKALRADPTNTEARRSLDEVEQTRIPVQQAMTVTTATYRPVVENPFTSVDRQPLSTFSIDVDTASYANVRRFLNSSQRPPADAVRLEEMINYFPYSYAPPQDDKPFAVKVDMGEVPWQPLHRLARIAIKGREIKSEERQAANFTFLLDVSGSMSPPERLPLIKQALRLLVEQLREDDRVSIVTYASGSGLALDSTTGDRKETILEAINNLGAGGSTNGAGGIRLAYEQAVSHFKKGGINRVILCTDGDFNVGMSSVGELEQLIAEKAKSGVFLSVLGVGTDNLHDHTMQTLADRGNGNYHYIDSLGEARKVLVQQMTGTLVTIAKDVKIQIEFNPAQVAAYRLIGYEKRMLAKEDFNNDKKDAGEIGAGHTITALYEIVPASLKYPDGAPVVDSLKYDKPAEVPAAPAAEAPAKPAPPASKETMTVKLRYKEPTEDKSKLIEIPVTDTQKKLGENDRDFQFAVSVAGFGMLLRGSPYGSELTWDAVREMALAGKGTDEQGWRGEFIQLVDKARGICGDLK